MSIRPLIDVPAALLWRRIVGGENAWRDGLKQAWGNPHRIQDSDVLRYQWPSIGKGWEHGFLGYGWTQTLPRDMTDKELLEKTLALPNTTVDAITASKDKSVPPAAINEFLEEFAAVHVVELEGLGHEP